MLTNSGFPGGMWFRTMPQGTRYGGRMGHNTHLMNRIAFRNPGIAYPDRYLFGRGLKQPLQVGNMTLSIQGTGNLTADIDALGDMAAAIAGLATVTMNADQGVQISASMAGTSTVSFPLDGIGNMVLTVNIGFQPSADDVASNILDAQLVEVGLNVRQALRLIAAALAGKLSGAPGATITIRNAVADSKNRITASVDASGNRTGVTVDLSN